MEENSSECDYAQETLRWPILKASTEDLLQELRRVDPGMASRWHPKDRRKIRRSLQLYLQTGKTASNIYAEQLRGKARSAHELSNEIDETPAVHDPLVFWIHASKETLDLRLNDRVDQMMSRGLLDEIRLMKDFVKRRQEAGTAVDQDHGIWVAIGYKEFVPFLFDEDFPHLYEAMCLERTKIATRQYAKRQVRWFRRKLVPAMNDAGKGGNLFLLDASDLSKWSYAVENFASDILEIFLQGGELPCPTTLSPEAEKMLTPEEKTARSARYCKICDKTLMSDFEWERHLRSKGHRGATRPKAGCDSVFPKAGNRG